MKAAQLVGLRHFEIVDVPMPDLGDGSCLIELEAWSVCGSDIKHQYATIFPEENYPLDVGQPNHEIAGTIVESRSEKFNIGQRVIAISNEADGLKEYVEASDDLLVALPDEDETSDWLMCQPSGTVLYACARIGTILGKRVMILGQGGIGQSFAAICSRSGASQVITVDPLAYRLELSSKFGATHTINPSTEPLDEAVEEITEGRLPDIVVEAAGYPDTLDAATRLVGMHGKVIMFGAQQNTGEPNSTVPLNARGLLYKNATLIANASRTSGDPTGYVEMMVELRRRGWWDPAEMITHRMLFDDVQRAYDMYETREGEVLKVVLSK